jgi:hypothetical protein
MPKINKKRATKITAALIIVLTFYPSKSTAAVDSNIGLRFAKTSST